MVRNYKKKEGTTRLQYSQDDVAAALVSINEGESITAASRRTGIPKTTLLKRYKGKVAKAGQSGRHTALLAGEELALAQNVAALGDFGYAFDLTTLRQFIHFHLNSMHRVIPQFKNNYPGVDWAYGFLKRHENILTQRTCQNITRKRAALSEGTVNDYFNRLQKTLAGVPPSRIINYDETNLTDDPKGRKMLFRKGIKYAERVMDTSKSSTSIMFAVTATGVLLPPYVVYKGQRMQDTWILGGPIHAKYNVSKSGWFDEEIFLDWLQICLIPFCRQEREADPEPFVIIGDNLSSHLSIRAVDICAENNIKLCFLPPNSTHLLQPLDVGVFSVVKSEWRKIITAWKEGDGRNVGSLPKWVFPRLLLQLLEAMEEKWKKLCVSAFKTCGINPCNAEVVLCKIRRDDPNMYDNRDLVSPNMLKFLQESREKSVKRQAPRRKALSIQPGASISLAELQAAGPSGCAPPKTPVRPPLDETSSESEIEEDSSVDEDEEIGVDEDPFPDEEIDEEIGAVVPKVELSENKDITPNSYVLVRFDEGKLPHHYMGQVVEISDDACKIDFFRKCETNTNLSEDLVAFKKPEARDLFSVSKDQIVQKLLVDHCYKSQVRVMNTFTNLVVR